MVASDLFHLQVRARTRSCTCALVADCTSSQPMEFLNDTVIDFYLKKLEEVRPRRRARVAVPACV